MKENKPVIQDYQMMGKTIMRLKTITWIFFVTGVESRTKL